MSNTTITGSRGLRLRWPWRNPMTIKELRGSMRGRRAFVVLTLYLLALSGMISIIYLAYSSAASQPFGPNPRKAGKAVLGAIMIVQVILVTLIGPAFTAGSISGEKERQTYDLLRTTLLSAHSFVGGKLLSALSYVFLLLLAAVPLLSIAFMLGGVSIIELGVSQLLLVVSAIAYALIGLFFSAIMRSTIAASVATFATAVGLAALAPALGGIMISMFGAAFFGLTGPPWPLAGLLIMVGTFLVMTNLPATIIMSEIILMEEGAIFYYPELIDGHTVYIISPWFGYIVLYGLLSLFLYWICVRLVRRVAKR